MDIDSMTPIEALKEIARLQRLAAGKSEEEADGKD
jgi:hypothetical protein